jgi:hypothetical protein
MIHSRPGFASVVTRDEHKVRSPAPAQLNADMIPALHRKQVQTASPLDARTAAAVAKLEAEKVASPEILVNPAPSAPPVVLEPGK